MKESRSSRVPWFLIGMGLLMLAIFTASQLTEAILREAWKRWVAHYRPTTAVVREAAADLALIIQAVTSPATAGPHAAARLWSEWKEKWDPDGVLTTHARAISAGATRGAADR